MVGHQETMIGVQDITCLGSIDKWLTSRKPMAGAQKTKGWGRGNQWLGSREPIV